MEGLDSVILAIFMIMLLIWICDIIVLWRRYRKRRKIKILLEKLLQKMREWFFLKIKSDTSIEKYVNIDKESKYNISLCKSVSEDIISTIVSSWNRGNFSFSYQNYGKTNSATGNITGYTFLFVLQKEDFSSVGADFFSIRKEIKMNNVDFNKIQEMVLNGLNSRKDFIGNLDITTVDGTSIVQNPITSERDDVVVSLNIIEPDIEDKVLED